MPLDSIPHRKILIGVIHLKPLPGAPRWAGDMAAVLSAAVADAVAYEEGGADAVIVENFGDVPFSKNAASPEAIAAMARAGAAVREAVALPLGFNVLRNDARAALALCAACDGAFIRINVHTGAMITDQGLIEGQAHETLRERQRLCPNAKILADVQVKHATPIGSESLEDAACGTIERGLADAIIVTGSGTGKATDPGVARRINRAFPNAKLLIGSGVNAKNVEKLLPYASGFIVGSSLKEKGKLENPVDEKRVKALKKKLAAWK